MNSHRYYQCSGRFSLPGLLLAIVIVLVSAAILGSLYSLMALYNPFTPINFLGTFLVGFLLWTTVFTAVYFGKIRNQLIQCSLGVLAAFSAVYINWVTYIFSISDFELIVLNPLHIVQLLIEIGEEGTWSLGSFQPTEGSLYTIWFLEATFIMGTALRHIKGVDNLFCEQCHTWLYVTERALAIQPVTNKELFVSDMENENYDTLLQIDAYDGGPEFTQVDLFGCPNCEEDGPYYMSASHVTISTDEDGEILTQDNTPIFAHLLVSASFMNQINERMDAIDEKLDKEFDEALDRSIEAYKAIEDTLKGIDSGESDEQSSSEDPSIQ